jgi:hypothetical protein
MTDGRDAPLPPGSHDRGGELEVPCFLWPEDFPDGAPLPTFICTTASAGFWAKLRAERARERDGSAG